MKIYSVIIACFFLAFSTQAQVDYKDSVKLSVFLPDSIVKDLASLQLNVEIIFKGG